MPKTISLKLVLQSSALVTGIVLLIIAAYIFVKPIIARYEQIRKEDAAIIETILKPAFTGADSFRKIGSTVFRHRNASMFRVSTGSKIDGYAIEGYGKGYSGRIRALVITDCDFRIISVKVMHQSESCGLGDKIAAPDFLLQFVGKTADSLRVKVGSDTGSGVSAITGATISTCGLVDAVKPALVYLKNHAGR